VSTLGPWITNGNQPNPGSNAVLADTGQVDSTQLLKAWVVANSDVASTMDLQWVDTDNVSVLKAQRMFVSASAPYEVYINFTIQVNQRLRVIMTNAITGNACVSIFPIH
jgi:hypothetical protein